jgi:hypothetical protein
MKWAAGASRQKIRQTQHLLQVWQSSLLTAKANLHVRVPFCKLLHQTDLWFSVHLFAEM